MNLSKKISEARLRYPPNLGDEDTNPSWIQFAFYDRKDEKNAPPSDTIDLYMPEQISQPSTVSWDSESFGFVGNALRKGAINFRDRVDPNSGLLTMAQQAASAAGDNARMALGGAGNALDLASARSMADIGAAAVALMGGNVSAEGLMGAVANKLPNPYLTMIFRGINFREFSFSFKFFPYSEDDCETIDEIIKVFRANSLPNYESGDAFLGYPKECDITYMWRGERNPYLHRFKRSVCTMIDVDYTGSGMFTTMRNGFPSEIVMATKWTEIELVTREDIFTDGEEGGY